MYRKQPTPDRSLNDLRYMLYCQKSGKSSLELLLLLLPLLLLLLLLLLPCFNVFQQHCKRANYQAYMWRQCFIPMMETGEPADHRWCMDDGKLDNQWMTCNPSLDAVHIIKQKICIYTYAFLSLNHHIKFILVFYHLCRF